MIVKFSKHGKGKASGVLDYLLKEKGSKGTLVPRTHAKVLYGDPVLTEHLINTTSHRTKYKSGYLSFSDHVSRWPTPAPPGRRRAARRASTS